MAMMATRTKVVPLLLLALLAAHVDAAPSHYWHMHCTEAVRAAHRALRTQAATGARRQLLAATNASSGGDASGLCGQPPEHPERDPMWFTQAGCSVAGIDDFAYLDEGTYRIANKGELVKSTCDDVFCPVPSRPDCYELQDVCKENEFCWINQHEKWGSWAMGENGKTLTYEGCDADAVEAINDANVTDAKRRALRATLAASCNTGIYSPKELPIWKPVRGQCTTYRQEQQSCIENPLAYTNSKLNPEYKRRPNGQVFERPLVCDPRGGPGGSKLTCTGPDFDVLPNTCVVARPPNVCFSGPWWYSLDCPRTAPGAPSSGLSSDTLKNVLATAMLLYPGEVGSAATCAYWDPDTQLGRSSEATRRRTYAIVAALWPEESVAGPAPSYEDVMEGVPNSDVTADIGACYEDEGKADSAVARQLAELGQMTMQPNKIWSLAHFLVHNQPAFMVSDRVEGSKALASLLLEAFWCDDCRGFFYGGIISVYGMPPDVPDQTAHARWWWWAHNVASEHVAAIRGGHPWIHQAGAADVKRYQNPYFMTWEDAVAQWTQAAD